MLYLGIAIAVLAGIASLICFIAVVVQMFQRGQQGLGIACIILAVCTGIGPLIAFIFGWVKSSEWNIKNLMLIWTGAIVAAIIGYVLMFAGGFDLATRLGDPTVPRF